MTEEKFILPQINARDDLETLVFNLNIIVDQMMKGKTLNTGSITLSTSTASTTISLSDGLLGTDTVITFEPKSALAAAEITTMFVSSRDVLNSTFTLTHANNSNDRTFSYVLTG